MEVATEFLTLGMIKMEEWLETMSILVTDLIPPIDSMTTLAHSSRYNMSVLAEWFHMIPRMDIHLHQLPSNVTFDPSDNEYLESLGILVALPGIWLILTLLFFLIFFLCRCCDGSGGSAEQQKQLNQQHQQASVGKTLKPKSLTGCKVCLVLMTTITLLVIIGSLFGSIIAHRGMIKVRNSADDVAVVLETVQNDTRTVVNLIRDQVDVKIENLKQAVDRSLVRESNSDMKVEFVESFFHLKKNVTKCKKRTEEIYSRVSRLNLRPIPDTIDFAERVRWFSTFAFGFLLIIFCLILFCGVRHSSRCTLILFSVFGLLTLVVGWVLTSFYFGVMVAGSDFCAEPETFLADRLSSSMELALFDYYVKCSSPNPFNRQVKDSISTVENAHDVVRRVEMICYTHCQSDQQQFVRPQIENIVENLKTAENIMRRVQGMLDCSRIHDDYADSMTASCKDVIEGSFILLVTSAVIGFLFTILVLCSSHTWIHLRPPKNNAQGGANNSIGGHSNTSALLANLDNDESEPFLSSTPHHANTLHHQTLFSNNSISSSVTNTSVGNKRFRDSYMSAYGTTGRGRFTTPPQTPHFTTLGGAASSSNVTNNRSGRSEEQLAFLSPPPAYDQLTQQQQQQLHYQQQQQQQQHQQQQHQIYGSHVQHHTSTLPHHHHMQQQHLHHHHQQQQQQPQPQHHQMQPHMHHQQQQQMQQQQQQHHQAGTLGHQQSAIGHYVSTKYY